jgi:hypothetical protein
MSITKIKPLNYDPKTPKKRFFYSLAICPYLGKPPVVRRFSLGFQKVKVKIYLNFSSNLLCARKFL